VAATFNIHYAKTHLSKLLEQVQSGEEIIIAKAGKPVAKLCPVEKSLEKSKPKRMPGSLKGKVRLSPDFSEPVAELERAFYGSRKTRR
jgi:prevent-host-death family protein